VILIWVGGNIFAVHAFGRRTRWSAAYPARVAKGLRAEHKLRI